MIIFSITCQGWDFAALQMLRICKHLMPRSHRINVSAYILRQRTFPKYSLVNKRIRPLMGNRGYSSVASATVDNEKDTGEVPQISIPQIIKADNLNDSQLSEWRSQSETMVKLYADLANTVNSPFVAVPVFSGINKEAEISKVTEPPTISNFMKLFMDLRQYHDLAASCTSSLATDERGKMISMVAQDYQTLLSAFVAFKRPSDDLFRIIEELTSKLACMCGKDDRDLIVGINMNLFNSVISAACLHQQPSEAEEILNMAASKSLISGKSSHYVELIGTIVQGFLNNIPLSNRTGVATNENLIRATSLAMNVLRDENLDVDVKIIRRFMVFYNRLADVGRSLFWLDIADKLERQGRLKKYRRKRSSDTAILTPLYNLALDTYCRVGDIRSALELLKQMKNHEFKNIMAPNAFTYGSIMHLISDPSLSRRLHHSHESIRLTVMDLMQDMKRNKIPVLAENWNVPLWNHAKNGRTEKVERYFAKMEAGGRKMANTLTFNSLIIAWATKVGVHPRNSFYEDIVRGTSHLYSSFDPETPEAKSIMEANEKTKQNVRVAFEKATGYFKMMQERNVPPNAKTFNTLLHLAINLNEQQVAVEIWNRVRPEIITAKSSLQHSLISLNTQSLAPRQLNTFGDESDHVVESANPRAQADIITFNTLIAVYAREKSPRDIERTLADMNILHQSPDEWTLALCLQGLVRRNPSVNKDDPFNDGMNVVKWVCDSANWMNKKTPVIRKEGVLDKELLKLERWEGVSTELRKYIRAFRVLLPRRKTDRKTK